MSTWSSPCLPLRVVTTLLLLGWAVCQNVINDGVCGVSKGCFSHPAGCDPAASSTDTNRCTAFSAWSYDRASNRLEIGLRADTDKDSTYVAIGFSKSGNMEDSDVYACTSRREVVRSRNAGTGKRNTPTALIGVSDEAVSIVNRVITCTFMRAINLPAGQDDSGNFFDLDAREYTALLVWGGDLTEEGAILQHMVRVWSPSQNFLEILEISPPETVPTDQNVIAPNDNVCGESRGCFSSPAGCNPVVPSTDPNGCRAFSSWSFNPDNNKLEIELRADTSTYIAIGFSKSGGMEDSDVYACTSDREVVRSRNAGTGRSNSPAELIGVSEQDVRIVNGVITCSFMREINRQAGQDDDGNFFDLNEEYTALLAWGGDLTNDGAILQHRDRSLSADRINFLENTSAEAGFESLVLAKLHGCLMVLAWFGFASIGITTARFFKKALPGKLCGKPSWFAVHRLCMVSAFVLTVIAFILIIIHVGGYLGPGRGTIRFTHTVFGTIVVVLAVLNVVMATVRPHPGEPMRDLFNWAHWGVGVTAHLLAGITVMLGTSNQEGQTDVLLSTVLPFVFWLVIALTFFDLFSWLALTVIDIVKKKDSPNVTVHHLAGTDNTHASTNHLTTEEPQQEPVIKLVIYGVYFAVVAAVVGIIVLTVGIGNYGV